VGVWDIGAPLSPVFFQVIVDLMGQEPYTVFVYENELLLVSSSGSFPDDGGVEILDVSSFYASGFVLNGTTESDFLFPLPIFPVGEDLTQFELAILDTDTFSRPRFCLNAPQSFLNDPTNPYSIVRSVAGGIRTQSIAEQLLVMEMSGYFDGGSFSGGAIADTFDNASNDAGEI
jgi:hypothetical protein